MSYYFRKATVVSKSSSEVIPQGNYPCCKPYTNYPCCKPYTKVTVDTNKIQMGITYDNQHFFYFAHSSCLAAAKYNERYRTLDRSTEERRNERTNKQTNKL